MEQSRVTRRKSLVEITQEIFEKPDTDVASCAHDVLRCTESIFHSIHSRFFVLESEATVGRMYNQKAEKVEFAVAFEMMNGKMGRADPDNMTIVHLDSPINSIQSKQALRGISRSPNGEMIYTVCAPMIGVGGVAIGVLEVAHSYFWSDSMTLGGEIRTATEEEIQHLETFAKLCTVGMTYVMEWEDGNTSTLRSIAAMRSELSSIVPSGSLTDSAALSSTCNTINSDVSNSDVCSCSGSLSSDCDDTSPALSADVMSTTICTSESQSSVSIDSYLLTSSRSSSSFTSEDSEVEPQVFENRPDTDGDGAYTSCDDALSGDAMSTAICTSESQSSVSIDSYLLTSSGSCSSFTSEDSEVEPQVFENRPDGSWYFSDESDDSEVYDPQVFENRPPEDMLVEQEISMAPPRSPTPEWVETVRPDKVPKKRRVLKMIRTIVKTPLKAVRKTFKKIFSKKRRN